MVDLKELSSARKLVDEWVAEKAGGRVRPMAAQMVA